MDLSAFQIQHTSLQCHVPSQAKILCLLTAGCRPLIYGCMLSHFSHLLPFGRNSAFTKMLDSAFSPNSVALIFESSTKSRQDRTFLFCTIQNSLLLPNNNPISFVLLPQLADVVSNLYLQHALIKL